MYGSDVSKKRHNPEGSPFQFSDYTYEQLKKIARHLINKTIKIRETIKLDEGADKALNAWMKIQSVKTGKKNKNAKDVLDLINPIVTKHTRTLAFRKGSGKKDIITVESIPTPADKIKSKDYQDALEKLDKQIGQNKLKIKIKSIVDGIIKAFNVLIEDEAALPNEDFCYHMVFQGPPGTGKTTFAEIIGKMFVALGLFQTEKEMKRCQGSDFLKDQNKVDEIFQSALGGVLFIDEAYVLDPAQSPGSKEAAKSAVDSMLTYLEDYRTELIVIFAGYEKEMQDFLTSGSNQGLKSRIPTEHVLTFEPYNHEELYQIFELYLKDAVPLKLTQKLKH